MRGSPPPSHSELQNRIQSKGLGSLLLVCFFIHSSWKWKLTALNVAHVCGAKKKKKKKDSPDIVSAFILEGLKKSPTLNFMHTAFWAKMPFWCHRRLARLLCWVERNVTVTQITTCYKHGMQKSISECTTYQRKTALQLQKTSLAT